jgi:hypothetical protein
MDLVAPQTACAEWAALREEYLPVSALDGGATVL